MHWKASKVDITPSRIRSTNLVRDSKDSVLRWNEGTYLRHHLLQTNLPKVNRFACHVRPFDDVEFGRCRNVRVISDGVLWALPEQHGVLSLLCGVERERYPHQLRLVNDLAEAAARPSQY